MSDLHAADELAAIVEVIEQWIRESLVDHPLVTGIDRGTSDETVHGEPRWYIRMLGEAKDVTAVWFTLGQRTLRYETYVMPAPEEQERTLFEHVLRRNDKLVGAHFSIGAENALYLRGEIVNAAVDADELDRILGTLYSTVEHTFRGLLEIGFASRFGG